MSTLDLGIKDLDMDMYSQSFKACIEDFDAANQADPRKTLFQGNSWAYEHLYGLRMTSFLKEFEPNASEELHLAARCQHICRWEIPRSSFPMDKKGYYAWRNKLKVFHGEKAAEIMSAHGYSESQIERVKELLSKKKLRKDLETQILEDVICLVFLQFYLDDFAEGYPAEKVIDILQKTWRKMSDRGQKKALELDLTPSSVHLIQQALS
ncbi:MAG: DUF4202 domain-containing protein [Bacteroidota bacterium]